MLKLFKRKKTSGVGKAATEQRSEDDRRVVSIQTCIVDIEVHMEGLVGTRQIYVSFKSCTYVSKRTCRSK